MFAKIAMPILVVLSVLTPALAQREYVRLFGKDDIYISVTNKGDRNMGDHAEPNRGVYTGKTNFDTNKFAFEVKSKGVDTVKVSHPA